MNDEKLKISTTTDGQPPRPGFETASAPAPINPATGQHAAYWVLTEAERKKGFVRPVRDTYRHVGIRPKHPLRDLTPEEKERYSDYVKFEQYPEGSRCIGRYWTEPELSSGCGQTTTMGRALAETWAADLRYYGSTFCAYCGRHISVDEFEWLDGQRLGT